MTLNALLPMKPLPNKNVAPPTECNVLLLITKSVQTDTQGVMGNGMEDIEAKEASVDMDEVGFKVNIKIL